MAKLGPVGISSSLDSFSDNFGPAGDRVSGSMMVEVALRFPSNVGTGKSPANVESSTSYAKSTELSCVVPDDST
jgi:hypothetical protein